MVLARAFPRGHRGFYIDVGAAGPLIDSVTKYFYDLGWSGVNVEPTTVGLSELEDARPRDVNLGVALGREQGVATFYELPHHVMGCSTFSPELAERYRGQGLKPHEREVTVTTLAQVCEEHMREQPIDFLKIDVEGDEESVLAGADFARFRPRVLVVEATEPGTPVPTHQGWEPIVLRAGYTFVLFDGVNRFYVRDEDQALAPALAVPANFFDDYVSYACSTWREAAALYEQAQQDLAAVRRAAEESQLELEAAQRTAAEASVSKNEIESRARSLEVALAETRQRLTASQRALRDARTQLETWRDALDMRES
jgi:FkbM family methyltransferase